MQQSIQTHGLSELERDTYASARLFDKENTDHEEVLQHWEARAQRRGVQSVMSARHTLEENEQATDKLKTDAEIFLEDHLANARVIELGTGIGRMTEMLANRARYVTSLDFSPAMIQRARDNLREYQNLELLEGRITDFEFEPSSFDLAFESIVLLHILDPKELKATAKKLRSLSNKVFLCEHVYEGRDFPISRYTLLRKPEEYEDLMRPYRLVKQKTHYCAGDKFKLMLFEK